MGSPASFVTAASVNDVNTFTDAQTFTGGVAVTGGVTGGVKGRGTFTSGSYTFVAGDVIDVRIRTGSGWSATTADASIAVEIET